MPIGGSTIDGCDCPGITQVRGVLLDGVIPSIDTEQQGWASELFTVNRRRVSTVNWIKSRLLQPLFITCICCLFNFANN